MNTAYGYSYVLGCAAAAMLLLGAIVIGSAGQLLLPASFASCTFSASHSPRGLQDVRVKEHTKTSLDHI